MRWIWHIVDEYQIEFERSIQLFLVVCFNQELVSWKRIFVVCVRRLLNRSIYSVFHRNCCCCCCFCCCRWCYIAFCNVDATIEGRDELGNVEKYYLINVRRIVHMSMIQRCRSNGLFWFGSFITLDIYLCSMILIKIEVQMLLMKRGCLEEGEWFSWLVEL